MPPATSSMVHARVIPLRLEAEEESQPIVARRGLGDGQLAAIGLDGSAKNYLGTVLTGKGFSNNAGGTDNRRRQQYRGDQRCGAWTFESIVICRGEVYAFMGG
eukprot:CAMPEP_0172551872 /NCGR_PEP_ID=MMETSP1067-20121228/41785_1 /TAXON_ID=265564 ORGANISM="Thalassiosira punctigera, Strain Tpunct2005C2" /NCGR_SAMPLE_ID=MMETSP1067 /ASSEMBLY_ACC=CAM_ASM_000444 /LENGTH=102 /DNA_ID=CAMNT_0013339721 /DNA_START=224 /DNA_END=528 /DNA_ORIENTATION=+